MRIRGNILAFDTEEENECIVPRSWIGEHKDINTRTKMADNLWWRGKG